MSLGSANLQARIDRETVRWRQVVSKALPAGRWPWQTAALDRPVALFRRAPSFRMPCRHQEPPQGGGRDGARHAAHSVPHSVVKAAPPGRMYLGTRPDMAFAAARMPSSIAPASRVL